jgi:Transglutaminase-like superfamily
MRTSDLPGRLEAALLLSLAALARRAAPFHTLAAWSARPPRTRPGPSAVEQQAVAAHIASAAHHLPWPENCLEKALAAQTMLRARGIPSQLVYGVGHDAQGRLTAHAWLRGPFGVVVGGEAAGDFTPVARFPAEWSG